MCNFHHFGYTYCMNHSNTPTSTVLKRIFPFTLLNESDLQMILPQIETVDLSSGGCIYKTGDVPDSLYFILSGGVRLIIRDPDQGDMETTLSTGDHFGAEVLSSTDYRLNDAVCSSDTRLLRLNRDELDGLSKTYPAIRKALRLIYRTHKHWNHLVLPWLGEDEKVLLISRRHPLFLFLRVGVFGVTGLVGSGILLSLAIAPTGISTGLLIFALFIFLLGAFLAIWAGLEWTNDYFFITGERVLVQKKMVGFYDSRQESPYSAILSTGLDSTIWGRAFGFGAIHLRTYTGNLTFKRLPFPEVIYDLLEFQRYRSVRETQQQDRAEIRDTLQERIQGKSATKRASLKDLKPEMSSTYTSGSLLDLLARFYGLRRERSGSVIYRTHWWKMLGKTILPSLLLIGVVVFLVLRWIGLTPSLTDTQAYGAALIVALVSWCWWLYQYIDWHNDIYIITPDQLVDVNRTPLGKEERRSAPIKNIQTVQFKRKGIIGLVLNFGTVRIQIGNEELTFDNVYDPAAIQAEVFSYFKKYNQRIHKVEQEKLADWIKTYDEIRHGRPGTSQNQDKNG